MPFFGGVRLTCFGFPLTEDRVRAIEAGDIKPMPPTKHADAGN